VPTLTGPHRPPKSGNPPDSLIILLHGIGSDGEDLISLANMLENEFPNTAFHAPNAPQPYQEAGFGYQWYPRFKLTEDDNAERVSATLNAFIDDLLAKYKLGSSRCVLVGFSQGSITAMHVAPRRTDAVAGVVAFSGAMPTAATLRKEMASSPPHILIHGSEDQVLSPKETENAAWKLDGVGIPVSVHILPGLGHSIDQRGLSIAIQFIKQALKTS
jgi:phospholipase/carboxylesterase